MATSLFTIVHYSNQAGSDMNQEFDIIQNWAPNFRMSFASDLINQAVEVTFSRKKIVGGNSPPVLFNDFPIIEVNKHLGTILDSEVSLASHTVSILLNYLDQKCNWKYMNNSVSYTKM